MTMLVVGSARCVWDDLHTWISSHKAGNFDTIAINSIIPYVPWAIQHAASYEYQGLFPWLAIRKVHCPEREGHIFTHSSPHLISGENPGIDYLWDFDPCGGSSGMLAVKVALAMGYERVVMAGIPLDDTGRFHDPYWMNKEELSACTRCADYTAKSILYEWDAAAADQFKGRVRSLSGNSRVLLGEPDYEAHQ